VQSTYPPGHAWFGFCPKTRNRSLPKGEVQVDLHGALGGLGIHPRLQWWSLFPCCVASCRQRGWARQDRNGHKATNGTNDNVKTRREYRGTVTENNPQIRDRFKNAPNEGPCFSHPRQRTSQEAINSQNTHPWSVCTPTTKQPAIRWCFSLVFITHSPCRNDVTLSMYAFPMLYNDKMERLGGKIAGMMGFW
jgi:hypothetical protein